MKRSASAVWKGGLKDGRGTVSTDSGVLSNTPYTFKMRFENEKGTNPEELVAAAHAACFSMALSLFLGEAGMTAERIQTKATVSLDQVDGGFGDERQDSEREQGRVRQSCRDSENRLSDLQAAQCKITMDAALV
jgi:OsmC subfamily peroxiredoxin